MITLELNSEEIRVLIGALNMAASEAFDEDEEEKIERLLAEINFLVKKTQS
jgi:hypothetical protein